MADFASWVNNNRSLWTRVYDEVIAPDFEKEWKKREEEQKNELKQRDENQELLFKYINQQIVKTAHLVEENERLETELQQRVESTAPSTTFEDATTTTSMGVSEDEHRNLAEKYDELSKKYQDLSQKVKYLERKNNAVMQKNRDMKDSVRAWQQYADRQKPNQKPKGASRLDEGPSRLLAVSHNDEAPPHMPSSPRSVGTVRTPLLCADRGHSSPAPSVLLTDPEAVHEAAAYQDEGYLPSASVTPKGPTAVSRSEPQDVARGDSSLNVASDRGGQLRTATGGVPSSSQTTVDEAADQANRLTQTIDVEDEDDWPQIVSERSLKRKRDQHPKVDIYAGRSSDGTPARPHRVKDEPLSSPPPAVHVLMRTETVDLDDPAPDNLAVPQPPQESPFMHSNTAGAFRHQRSSSAPFSQGPGRDNTHRDHRARDHVSSVQARLQAAAAEMRALSVPTNPHLEDQHVLQSLDPNIMAPTSEHYINKRLKQVEVRRVEHSLLAESGEALPPVDENELRLPPSAARARFNHRIRATKDPQTPARLLKRTPASGSPLVKQEQQRTPPAGTPRPAQTPSGSNAPRTSTSSARTDQQHDIVPDGRPVWSMRASEKRPSAPKSSTSPSSMQSRLRTKPVRELKVHDFKPNPAYNQGYTYAFSEAVRKRSDRLCLPGCTNPQCCGSTFRRLAEALDVLPAIQEEALLEDYLGDAYSSVICTQMSSDERAELVLQARTKKMAKDVGKHREAYERRRTPPGFWRVDFPTTQEQEDDRVRAKEQEAKTVHERWLEAQQKGGKWIFRDE
ncbi:uncharacterized protein EKO05_0008795 [Ascochyta rabiei]|uniref:Uncharacterized protein n=1 Tax=Didymella rabiei TaxID=5454 RepID=A0A163K1D8_DIDRA|nr:uncharacterized protein EKO05_0008795 [Ascochyta rabiei]KZM26717.1 hypothetical protein ST47_g2165 [Ascochyta rabiei]UPX18496.1 hypothetical protein EKO05_0008795 [Ascochyta rabiei]